MDMLIYLYINSGGGMDEVTKPLQIPLLIRYGELYYLYIYNNKTW